MEAFESLAAGFLTQDYPPPFQLMVAAPHGNEYFEDDVKVSGDMRICIDDQDQQKGYFCYQWLGKLDNNFHVLKTYDSGGGSGVFMELYFVQ